MHIEDLQLLIIGAVDRDEAQALLWDPMPGGSGLLQQMIQHFDQIVSIALQLVSDCPSDCMSSCNDCSQTFCNSFYHKYLDRHHSRAFLEKHGGQIFVLHPLPPTYTVVAPKPDGKDPVNQAENRLRSHGYQVITITFVELSDSNAIRAAFRRLAKYLSGRDLADRLGENMSWFPA